MNGDDIKPSLWIMAIVVPVAVVFLLYARPGAGEHDTYTYAVDSWSWVHFMTGFVLAGGMIVFKFKRQWILPAVTVVATGFEIYEHLYNTALAGDGGVEGANNIVLDIILVWLGAILVMLFYDYSQKDKQCKK